MRSIIFVMLTGVFIWFSDKYIDTTTLKLQQKKNLTSDLQMIAVSLIFSEAFYLFY